jgi:hypothetical protein
VVVMVVVGLGWVATPACTRFVESRTAGASQCTVSGHLTHEHRAVVLDACIPCFEPDVIFHDP